MAALDWIFVALLLASMLMGAWRGLVYEVLSLAGWVAAFLAAQWLAVDAAALLPLDGAQDAPLQEIVARRHADLRLERQRKCAA